MWKNDTELFDLIKKELFTAVVGDVLDTAGRIRQFLPQNIRALRNDMVVCGRAMTVLEADCFDDQPVMAQKTRPFGLMFEALDSLQENEVYICTGSSPDYALWGELMSTRAMQLKATGAVVNGFTRDTNGIFAINFPTFSLGTYAQDQRVRGRVIDYRCPIAFPNGVRVNPGDIVFGDIDGVVIIPKEIEEKIVLDAIEKVRGENKVRSAILSGMSTVEAWDTFGIM